MACFRMISLRNRMARTSSVGEDRAAAMLKIAWVSCLVARQVVNLTDLEWRSA